MKNVVTYTVHIETAEEGGFCAYFPSLPGCQTQGETLEEVMAMATDVLAGFLAVLEEKDQPIPVENTFRRPVGFDLLVSTQSSR